MRKKWQYQGDFPKDVFNFVEEVIGDSFNFAKDCKKDVKDSFRREFYKRNVPVNVIKTDTGFRLEVIAPGFQKEDFNIKLQENKLWVTAHREVEENEKEEYRRQEFHLAKFERAIHVPKTADTEKIEAKYEKGILEIFIPNKEVVEPESREINIS